MKSVVIIECQYMAIRTSGRKLRSQTQIANYAKHYKCFAQSRISILIRERTN